MSSPAIGVIGWVDLTVPNADQVRSFYQAVVGWTSSNVDMGGYSDFAMHPPASAAAVAGICHTAGTNAGLPPQWIIYITVADLETSLKQCREHGGEVVLGPKDVHGLGRYSVIRDPAGAVAALFEASA